MLECSDSDTFQQVHAGKGRVPAYYETIDRSIQELVRIQNNEEYIYSPIALEFGLDLQMQLMYS